MYSSRILPKGDGHRSVDMSSMRYPSEAEHSSSTFGNHQLFKSAVREPILVKILRVKTNLIAVPDTHATHSANRLWRCSEGLV